MWSLRAWWWRRSGRPYGAATGVGCVLCLESDCANGGHCLNVMTDYSCSCPPGYEGDYCQVTAHTFSVYSFIDYYHFSRKMFTDRQRTLLQVRVTITLANFRKSVDTGSINTGFFYSLLQQNILIVEYVYVFSDPILKCGYIS